jgi:hypothetical protein
MKWHTVKCPHCNGVSNRAVFGLARPPYVDQCYHCEGRGRLYLHESGAFAPLPYSLAIKQKEKESK